MIRRDTQISVPPYFRATRSFDGNGTYQNPYQIRSVDDFCLLATYVNAGNTDYNNANVYYNQMCDLDFSSIPNLYDVGGVNYCIGNKNTTYFVSKYNGRGFRVYNLNISTPTNVLTAIGLFGFVNTGAFIANIGIENNNNNSLISGRYAGAIVGALQDGTITNCFNKATVTSHNVNSHSHVGGIVGQSSMGTISNCANYGTVCQTAVSTNSYAGGILGYTTAFTTRSNLFCSGRVYRTNTSSRLGIMTGSATAGTLTYYDVSTVDIVGDYSNGDYLSFYTQPVGGVSLFSENCKGHTNPPQYMPLFDWLNMWETTESYPRPKEFRGVF